MQCLIPNRRFICIESQVIIPSKIVKTLLHIRTKCFRFPSIIFLCGVDLLSSSLLTKHFLILVFASIGRKRRCRSIINRPFIYFKQPNLEDRFVIFFFITPCIGKGSQKCTVPIVICSKREAMHISVLLTQDTLIISDLMSLLFNIPLN